MKERIQKLAEQANAWYPMGYPSPEGGDEAWENLVIFEREDLEKFAELIVRECCDIFVELRTRPADLAVKDVKKHFGVDTKPGP